MTQPYPKGFIPIDEEPPPKGFIPIEEEPYPDGFIPIDEATTKAPAKDKRAEWEATAQALIALAKPRMEPPDALEDVTSALKSGAENVVRVPGALATAATGAVYGLGHDIVVAGREKQRQIRAMTNPQEPQEREVRALLPGAQGEAIRAKRAEWAARGVPGNLSAWLADRTAGDVAAEERELAHAQGLKTREDILDPPFVEPPEGGGTFAEQGYRDAEADLASRLDKGTLENIYTDMGDVVSGLATLGAELGGLTSKYGEDSPSKSWVERQAMRNESDLRLGTNVYAGVTGGTAAMLANLDDAFETRPLSTLFMVKGPTLTSLRALNPALAGKIVALRTRVSQAVAQSRVGQLGQKAVPIPAWIQRTLGRETKQVEAAATKLGQDMIGGGERAAGGVEALGERIAGTSSEVENVTRMATQRDLAKRSMVDARRVGVRLKGMIDKIVNDPLSPNSGDLVQLRRELSAQKTRYKAAKDKFDEAELSLTSTGLFGDAKVAPLTKYPSYKVRTTPEGQYSIEAGPNAAAKIHQDLVNEGVDVNSTEGKLLYEERLKGLRKVRKVEVAPAVRVTRALEEEIDRYVEVMPFSKDRNKELVYGALARSTTDMLPGLLSSDKLRSRVLSMMKRDFLDETKASGVAATPDETARFLETVGTRLSNAEANMQLLHSKRKIPVPGKPDISANLTAYIGRAMSDPQVAKEAVKQSITYHFTKLADEVKREHMREQLLASAGDAGGLDPKAQAAHVVASAQKGSVPAVVYRLPDFEGLLPKPLRDRLKGYVEASPEVARYIGLSTKPAAATVSKGARVGDKFGADTHIPVYIHKGLHDTIEIYARAMSAIQEHGIANSIYSAIKRNLVPENPVAVINNVKSNLVTGILDGMLMTPVKAMDMIRVARDYVAGKPTNEAVGAIFRSGMSDTSFVRRELGGADAPGLVEKVLTKRLGRKFRFKHTLGKVSTKIHNAGDFVFKMWKGIREYARAKNAWGLLDDGEHIDLPIEEGVVARIAKGPAGAVVDGKPISDVMRQDLFARFAMKKSGDLYIDYSRSSRFSRRLSGFASGKAGILSVISPFFRWAHQAIWIPGVQKGIAGNLLFGDDIRSNSARVSRAIFNEQLSKSARMAAVVNGSQQELRELSKEREQLMKLSGFESRNMQSAVFDTAGPGGTLNVLDFTNASPFGPTITMMKGWQAAGVAIDPFRQYVEADLAPDVMAKLKESDPEEWASRAANARIRDLYDSGQLFQASDLINVFALGGSPQSDTLEKIDTSEQAKRSTDWMGVARRGTAMAVGGGYASIANLLIGTFDKDNPYSTLDPHNKYGNEVMRILFGLGMKRINLEAKKEQLFRSQSAALRSARIGPIDKRLAKMVVGSKDHEEALKERTKAEQDVKVVLLGFRKEMEQALKGLPKRPRQ